MNDSGLAHTDLRRPPSPGLRRSPDLQGDPTKVRVADIALRWGFFHQSRFAQQYRDQFHELPSVTLTAELPSRLLPSTAENEGASGRRAAPSPRLQRDRLRATGTAVPVTLEVPALVPRSTGRIFIAWFA
ncbi:hypothetical protein Prum_009840 [Phytohabitans rumicis]|uniref:HTH araC/xylS-type domain-containing protein n=1 Tax=Phytohabitans rumicis TaxID=1076125 RepID=A0A6V8KQ95_9ACTN|nr:hypothetical protein Prum_009840 [Phytohabitans rumicis]